MDFAIKCCCSRKIKRREMSDLKKDDHFDISENRLSDIYELVMTPCDNTQDLLETPRTPVEKSGTPKKKTDIYVNFFEEPNTPKTLTPRTPDVNENMINLVIPRGSELYVNYEKFNFT
jgi:hypothetical protein